MGLIPGWGTKIPHAVGQGQKTKQDQKTPSMQEGCYPVCLWTSAEATFFFLATWSLDGFPKDQERVGLTVVENI